mgnify:CR=1 FL=1
MSYRTSGKFCIWKAARTGSSITETAQQCDRNDAVTDTSMTVQPTTDARVERIVIGAVIGFAKSAKISFNEQG